jgi:hypothetical protein
MLRTREQGLILINLYREGCMRSAQYQFESWELSQHLLEDEGKPRNPCRDDRSQELSDKLTSSALARPCPSSCPLYWLLCTFCWTQRVPLLFLGFYLTYQWEQFIEHFHIVKFAAIRFTAQVTSSLSVFKASIWQSEDNFSFVKECFFKQWDFFLLNRPSATVARSDVVLLGYFVKTKKK